MPSEPLDKKICHDNDQSKEYPALHPHWKVDMKCLVYHPPPASADQAGIAEWGERITSIQFDLHQLLKMPHAKFWCQVIFDESVLRCVDSYLKFSPRSHDSLSAIPQSMLEEHEKLHKRVFMVCLRMATHKESKDSHITPSVFGEILYENFLFDIPKLMDICSLYGTGNGPLLTKMITNIFTQQSKYNDDLDGVVPTVLQVFDKILEQCGLSVNSPSGSPQKLSSAMLSTPSLAAMPQHQFQDIVFYLYDTAETLWAFLDTFPQGAKTFSDYGFPVRLIQVYETVAQALVKAFKKREWDNEATEQNLRRQFHRALVCFCNIFHQVVFQTYLLPVLDKNGEECEEHIEGYLEVMSAVMAEKRFVGHYQSFFPFEEDREILSQSKYSIDPTRIEFLQSGIMEAFSQFGKRSRAEPVTNGFSCDNAYEDETCELDMPCSQRPEPQGACSRQIKGVELQSLITSVKDLLPELGEGFIEICLEEYDYNIERVINGVLEDKLLPSLQDLDRTMARGAITSNTAEPETLVSQRANVYDNDEFDVFSRDKVDTTKIHQGKKNKTGNMNELDDKSELATVKELFNKYGNEDVETMYGKQYEYEDEYDDTYDTNEVGAYDAVSADEMTKKIFSRGNPNRRNQAVKEEDESDEEEEEARPRDQFIEDPAKIRARQEEKRAWNTQRKANKPQGQLPPRNYDTKGNPKGQGQSAEVQRNRQFKDKHKSSKANHNRRILADKKRKV